MSSLFQKKYLLKYQKVKLFYYNIIDLKYNKSAINVVGNVFKVSVYSNLAL